MSYALFRGDLCLAARLLIVVALANVCLPAAAQITSLSFRPSVIEYSRSLDKLVMVAGAPNQLHIYDPNAKTDIAVNLPLPPLSLSISPDGLYAAVGHDAYISYVNLSTGLLARTYSVSTKVSGLVLGSQYVYVLPDRYVNLSTGAEVGSSSFAWGTRGRLHPNGNGYTTRVADRLTTSRNLTSRPERCRFSMIRRIMATIRFAEMSGFQ